MNAALEPAWQRLAWGHGLLLLLSGLLLASGCAPVHSSAPSLLLHSRLTPFGVQYRPRGHTLRRAEAPSRQLLMVARKARS